MLIWEWQVSNERFISKSSVAQCLPTQDAIWYGGLTLPTADTSGLRSWVGREGRWWALGRDGAAQRWRDSACSLDYTQALLLAPAHSTLSVLAGFRPGVET